MEDDFAQSREPDDLFADEIEPATESDTEASSKTHDVGQIPAPTTLAGPPQPPGQQNHGSQGRRGRNSRGPRGGTRGGQNSGTRTTNASAPAEQSHTPAPQERSDEEPAAVSLPPAQPAPPASQEQRITSVRGDRSATGPAKPTKRTEAELDDLMKSMHLKNAAKTEAYERAEKDQANFLQREKQAAAKRIEERKALRDQDMERAKNRERKIKGQGGREWDSEKQESDIVDKGRGSSSMYTRGAHGGVSAPKRGLAASQFENRDTAEASDIGREAEGPRSRGRGSRGGRGGRGRGGKTDGANVNSISLPVDQDFPALPTSANTTNVKQGVTRTKGLSDSTWADEMSTAEKV